MTRIHRLLTRIVPLALAHAGLLGCSASANLADVVATQGASVLRSDQFQSAVANSNVLVAVGANGVVVSSADAGKSWTRQVVDAGASLIGAAVCPDGGFVALDFGRRVWIADAAAAAWTARPITTQATPLAVACDAKGQLWVVGSESAILSSADRGATWRDASLGEDQMFTTVQFVDEVHGVITGEFGNFLTTRDGGASWQPGTPIPNDFYPYSALFTDPQTGWVSGLAGTILHTTDGGASWRKQPNPTGAPMYGLARHEDRVYALGANGLVLQLADGQWQPVEGRAAPYLRSGFSLEGRGLLVAGGAGTLDIVSPTPATSK
ncbi:YCF48-related protein [Aromatoleum toluolicum]|uniref:Photosynthesis system II assembly factor Ycf48/Hcf136-like domain-containing protein n=1 Tax=Aromatoleum toluolicum TaxID=90060 RepID=A0ABX1NFJ9_9RHOO|nr:YCF48-related protein [Aromatoleum toluolicum]NMF97958.1 YCF48-related protein [Aromatoleum toluolicum]